ncbi:hypothetical protein DEJ17_15260 [Curtobacterium sp. MCSS17_011]|nr:hypothetical protein DEJ17_15260 [Curtobacterium sp. MCSS17_011]
MTPGPPGYDARVPEGVVSGIVFALTPTIVVGLIFWFVMRAIMRADRTERAAYAKVEAEERARFEREHGRPAPAPTSAE